MSTWKPISTAPKDRPIDLWSATKQRVPGCIWIEVGCMTGAFVSTSGRNVTDATHWKEIDKGPGMEEGEVRWMIEHRSGFLGSWAWKDQDVAIKDAKENFHGARVVRVRIVREEE